MTALILLRLRASLRRLVRGRPGETGWVVRAAGIGLLVLAADAVAFWLAARPLEGGGIAAQLAAPAGVVLGAAAGGSIVLLVEAAREQPGGAAGVPRTLPLSRLQFVLVDSAPGVLLTLALALAAIPPTAGVLAAAGLELASAFALASCAVSLGVAAATVVVVAATVLMPGPRWLAVRLPTAMLGAGGLLVAGVAQLVAEVADGRRGILGELLVLPGLIRAALAAEPPAAGMLVGTALAALLAVVVLAPLASARGWGTRTAVVRVSWRGRGAIGQVQAELLYALRSPLVIANGVSVLLLLGAAVFGVLVVDARVAEALLGLLVVVGCALAGSVVRLLRGLLPVVRTPQQLVGYGVGSFVASQLAVAVVLLALLLTPLLLLGIRPPADAAGLALDVATGALVAFAIAVLVSWAIPLEAATGAAQALAAFLTSVATVSVLAMTIQLPEPVAPAGLVAAGGAAVLAALAAAQLEARRWRPAPVQQTTDAHPARGRQRGRS